MSDYIPDDWPEVDGELPPSLEYLLGKFISAIQKATSIIRMDFTRLSDWYAMMRQAIITHIAASYMAGQNSSYVGVTESGHLYDYVKTQVDYLNNFRLVVQSASEWNAGWEQRAEQYARGIVAPYWRGRTKVLPLPAMPGDLSTDCGQLCACLWDVRTIDEANNDYDAYWLLNASRVIKTEHCQDCQTRAVLWNPVRIRGGRLVLEASEKLPDDFKFREAIEATLKHLPGKHEQKTHGRRGVADIKKRISDELSDSVSGIENIPKKVIGEFTDEFIAIKNKHNLPRLTEVNDKQSTENFLSAFLTDGKDIRILSINSREINNNLNRYGMNMDDIARYEHKHGGLASKSGRDIAYHEAIHYYHRTGIDEKGSSAIRRSYSISVKSGFIKNISTYAKKNEYEYFAELGVFIRNNGISGIPENIINPIKDILP